MGGSGWGSINTVISNIVHVLHDIYTYESESETKYSVWNIFQFQFQDWLTWLGLTETWTLSGREERKENVNTKQKKTDKNIYKNFVSLVGDPVYLPPSPS